MRSARCPYRACIFLVSTALRLSRYLIDPSAPEESELIPKIKPARLIASSPATARASPYFSPAFLNADSEAGGWLFEGLGQGRVAEKRSATSPRDHSPLSRGRAT